MRLATIILTYNEQDIIAQTLRSLPSYCDAILLDDSTDNTRQIAAESGVTSIIDIPEYQRGHMGAKYISALKYAYCAGYEYAVTTDSGDNFAPQWINSLLLNADGADVVIAQREFTGPGFRRLNSNIATFAVSLLGPKLRDATCGLRFYDLSKIDYGAIVAETAHTFQMEILVRMYKLFLLACLYQ